MYVWQQARMKRVRNIICGLVICAALIPELFMPVTAVDMEQENHLFPPLKSPNGLFVASVLNRYRPTQQFVLKNARAERILWTFQKGHVHDIGGFCWSPDSKKLAVVVDGTVRVLDSSNGHQLYLFDGIKGDAFTPDWSNDGKYIVGIGSKTKRPAFDEPSFVFVWNAATQKVLLEIDGRPGSIALWASDSKRVAFNTDEHAVQIWDVLSDKKLTTIPVLGGGRASIEWSPNGRYLVVSDYNVDEAIVYSSETGKPIVKHPFTGQILNLSWSKDGKSISCTPLLARYRPGDCSIVRKDF